MSSGTNAARTCSTARRKADSRGPWQESIAHAGCGTTTGENGSPLRRKDTKSTRNWRGFLELFGPGSDENCFLVAVQGDRIASYCQQRRERFAPFGTAEEMRGKGIGRLLLSH